MKTKNNLIPLINKYISENKLGKEKLALGSQISVAYIEKIRRGQQVKLSLELAIRRFLKKETEKAGAA